MTDLLVTSDAAGRMRVKVPWVRADSRRAVAVEEAVDKQQGSEQEPAGHTLM